MERLFFTLTVWMLSFFSLSAHPSAWPLELQVRVDGHTRPVYSHGGKHYLEALKGREYTLVMINHSDRRLAVALAVDGLNTIDARHTEPRKAMKWVIEPHDTVEISGWQVSSDRARCFYFTSESDSYGAALGQTQNLGIISAAVFREKAPAVEAEYRREAPAPATPGAGAPAESKGQLASSLDKQKCEDRAEDLAATGMGDSMSHRVERVRMELEPNPVQTINLHYEFRNALVKLGVLPQGRDRLERREHAQGFESPKWCPEPR